MSKVLQIDDKYLKELIEQVSKSVVGKVMKRSEILDKKEDIKSCSKELIYEGFRDLKNLLFAHARGQELTIFKFESGDKPSQ